MTQSPLKRRQYVWRWIWETDLDWNEISFDPNAQTSTQRPVSPTISHTAYLAMNTRVSCVDVWVCRKERHERENEREIVKEGRGRWSRAMKLDPLQRRKNHSVTVTIKACHSSITQIYQDIKCLTDVKRVEEHAERWFVREKKIYWLWKLCTHTCRGFLSWVLTMWQPILILFAYVNKVKKRQKQKGRDSWLWWQLKSMGDRLNCVYLVKVEGKAS